MNDYQSQERRRLALQSQLDMAKTLQERNRLGQFATPGLLADDLLAYAGSLLPPDSAIRFLDPAFGTGSFFSALQRAFPSGRIASALAYELDDHYGLPSKTLWRDTPLELRLGDFTRAAPPAKDCEKANLIICNPPYVRHHHLTTAEKTRLQAKTKQAADTTISKLAGLYCYFLLLSHGWLAQDGIAVWLIPSEFMDVNYGRGVKRYLLRQVTLLRVHRFAPSDVQFTDALVSSTVVCLRCAKPPENHTVEFTYGGTLAAPQKTRRIRVSTLEQAPKWTAFPGAEPQLPLLAGREPTLGDFFSIKRGVATGSNKFFILTPEQVALHDLPGQFLRPILPSARYLTEDTVYADTEGNPTASNQLYLLSCDWPEMMVQERFPSLWRYLQHGRTLGVHESYLCKHRSPWYTQEHRPPAPFLCTYMGRQRAQDANPFRFILNFSKAIAANSYHLLYPKPPITAVLAENPALFQAVWEALNAITPAAMIGEGRVYGGGLHKVEPKELANIPAQNLIEVLRQHTRRTLQATAITPIEGPQQQLLW